MYYETLGFQAGGNNAQSAALNDQKNEQRPTLNMNSFDQMRDAVREAKDTMQAADSSATEMAGILVGRLRHVNRTDFLKALKKELRDFNIHTRDWKQIK